MFRLSKTFHFEASHQLPFHGGKCRRLHGHSWVVRVICEGDNLIGDGSSRGMLVDYHDIVGVMEPLIKELDHTHLNDIIDNPTSERLAQFIFLRIEENLPLLVAVQVDETCSCSCEYRPV